MNWVIWISIDFPVATSPGQLASGINSASSLLLLTSIRSIVIVYLSLQFVTLSSG